MFCLSHCFICSYHFYCSNFDIDIQRIKRYLNTVILNTGSKAFQFLFLFQTVLALIIVTAQAVPILNYQIEEEGDAFSFFPLDQLQGIGHSRPQRSPQEELAQAVPILNYHIEEEGDA